MNATVKDVTLSHSALIPYLFPRAADFKTAPQLFALVGEDGEWNGAGILASGIGDEMPVFLVDLVSSEASSPALVGLLLGHCVDMARTLRAPALRMVRSDYPSETISALETLGFVELSHARHYEFQILTCLDIVAPQLARLRRAGKIPADVQVLPYSAGDQTAVDELCFRVFDAHTHGHLKAMGRYAPGDEDFSLSFRVDRGGRLAAALAIGIGKGVATFDPLLIAPGNRDTWVLPLVGATMAERLLARGIGLGHALIHEDNKKMTALMRKGGVARGQRETLFQLDLT